MTSRLRVYSLLAHYFLTDIFERFLELGERGEARLDDAVRPLVDLVVHVAVAADRALYRLLDDVGDLVDDELGLEEEGVASSSDFIGGLESDIIFLKHASSIFRQSSNPEHGFSVVE